MKLHGGLFGKKQKPVILTGRRRPLSGVDNQAPLAPGGKMFSYHAQRSNSSNNTGRRDTGQEQPARSHVTLSFATRHRWLSTILVLLGLAVVGYMLSLTGKPHIVLLQDQTTAYFLQADAVYQQAAEQSLSRSLFNRNKLTIDTSRVRLDLLKNYPEIKNASVALPVFGRQPQIYIEPYKPSFILTTTNDMAFVLDTTGRALATTSQIPDLDKLAIPTIQDRSGLAVVLGNRALPSTTVHFTQVVVATLQAGNSAVSSLTLPANAYELDVAIKGQPYFIKFNLENDPAEQAGTFLATKARLETDHQTVGQYIDVRTPERAYYK